MTETSEAILAYDYYFRSMLVDFAGAILFSAFLLSNEAGNPPFWILGAFLLLAALLNVLRGELMKKEYAVRKEICKKFKFPAYTIFIFLAVIVAAVSYGAYMQNMSIIRIYYLAMFMLFALHTIGRLVYLVHMKKTFL